jgi:hypothetical protein
MRTIDLAFSKNDHDVLPAYLKTVIRRQRDDLIQYLYNSQIIVLATYFDDPLLASKLDVELYST